MATVSQVMLPTQEAAADQSAQRGTRYEANDTVAQAPASEVETTTRPLKPDQSLCQALAEAVLGSIMNESDSRGCQLHPEPRAVNGLTEPPETRYSDAPSGPEGYEIGFSEQLQDKAANGQAVLPGSSEDRFKDSANGQAVSENGLSDSRARGIGVRLNIVMLVAGTYGDMQPFLALGKRLVEEHGHRVRLATHETYRQAVEKSGLLEFYPLGGDPKGLSGLLVKNRGFLPANPRELVFQRGEFAKIINSTWGACVSASEGRPFVADCIISNPPAQGHLHCAEKLGVPLHMVFTMPWVPTKTYPHPMSYVPYKPKKSSWLNKVSYWATDTFIFAGTSDHVQKFRRSIGLDTAPTLAGSGMGLATADIPWTFAWSPSLAPKASDWRSNIDVVGFIFPEGFDKGAEQYKHPEDLEKFLQAGPPPVYVGFGSMAMKDPQKVTNLVLAAFEKAGSRGIVASGWGKIGSTKLPENVFVIDHCPHSWLFPRCSAVVHHGGAGTTAAGLLAGRPTFVVNFFGDQQMWGRLVQETGCGPEPIPIGKLEEETMVEAIKFMKKEEVKEAAKKMATQLRKEDGVGAAIKSLHNHLPLRDMLCDLCPDRIARYYCKDCGGIKLSPIADKVLHSGVLSWHSRFQYRPVDWIGRKPPLPWRKPQGAVATFISEIFASVLKLFKLPLHGFKQGGFRGAFLGLLKSLLFLFLRPLRATAAFTDKLGTATVRVADPNWAKTSRGLRIFRDPPSRGRGGLLFPQAKATHCGENYGECRSQKNTMKSRVLRILKGKSKGKKEVPGGSVMKGLGNRGFGENGPLLCGGYKGELKGCKYGGGVRESDAVGEVEGMLEGLLLFFSILSKSLVSAAAAPIMWPLEGARAGGLKGSAEGVVRGPFGLLAKLLGGAFLGIAALAAGAAASVEELLPASADKAPEFESAIAALEAQELSSASNDLSFISSKILEIYSEWRQARGLEATPSLGVDKDPHRLTPSESQTFTEDVVTGNQEIPLEVSLGPVASGPQVETSRGSEGKGLRMSGKKGWLRRIKRWARLKPRQSRVD